MADNPVLGKYSRLLLIGRLAGLKVVQGGEVRWALISDLVTSLTVDSIRCTCLTGNRNRSLQKSGEMRSSFTFCGSLGILRLNEEQPSTLDGRN
jgi:hypothetical protein